MVNTEDAMETGSTHVAATDIATPPNMDAFDEKIKNLYHELYNNVELYNKIPYLDKTYFDSGNLVPNSVVRYRGIVQDILNPEFYPLNQIF